MHDIDRHVTFEPHVDPEHTNGFPLLHPYIEQVWLPLIGPSSVLLLRHVGRHFGTDLNIYDADLNQVAAEVGLGVGNGKNAPIRRVIERLIFFGHITYLEPNLLEVNVMIRRVGLKALGKLPTATFETHRLMTAPETVR